MKYLEIKNQKPKTIDCFFAFSDEQYNEGIIKNDLQGKKILKGKYGLFGTEEGIKNFLGFYDKQAKIISENCDPQEVYNFEFSNHECSYVMDDTEAINIVISYFGKEKAKIVKRRFVFKEL